MTTKSGYTLALHIHPLKSDIATMRELSKYIIEWKIVRKVFCNAKSNYCLLCLKEKYFIVNYPHEEILLNKRSELISKCRHQNKNMLANIGNSGKRNNDSMD